MQSANGANSTRVSFSENNGLHHTLRPCRERNDSATCKARATCSTFIAELMHKNTIFILKYKKHSYL